jgi:transcriptional activator SPT7
MDLQTMMKKVKQKQYKSKLEFHDDLELIWSNCLSYNSEVRTTVCPLFISEQNCTPPQNHPLSGCALRMKAKSEQMLKHITDHKERQDPPALDLKTPAHGPRPKINGTAHHVRPVTPDIKPDLSKEPVILPTSDSVDFADTVALLRDPYGMLEFSQLDRDLSQDMPSPVDRESVARDLPDHEVVDEELVQKRKS